MKTTLLGLMMAAQFCLGQEYLGFEQEANKKIDRYSLYESDYSYYPRESEASVISSGNRKRFGMVGSPFVDNRFRKGTIIVNKKEQYTVPMRYNADREVIEFVMNEKRFDLIRRFNVEAQFGGRKYIIMAYIDGGLMKMGYFNPLMDKGNFKLYFRPKKKIIREKRRYSEASSDSPAYCIDASSYYIKKGDLPAKEITLDENQMLAVLGNKSARLKTFIEANNLNLKKEQDAVRLLSYFNRMNEALEPDSNPYASLK